MDECGVHLLGPVQVVWEAGEPPRFRSQRTMALLGYLTAEGRPVSRDALATLFWPDAIPSKGKANLRRELHNLGNVLPDCWQADRQTVRFAPGEGVQVDVYELRRLEEGEEWVAAAELMRGNFLEGVYLEDNLEFETWLSGERERWRQRAERVLSAAIEEQERSGDEIGALRFARQLLQLLPWHEETHRKVMRLLALDGQRSAALRQYERCKAFLWEEMGVDVSAETQALYERIRDSLTFALHNIPAPTTPLIEREEELAQLERWLNDGDVRLVTITGAGGMGKTRLALGLAQGLLERPEQPFADGVYFVSLASIGDPGHLVSEIATALHFPLQGQDRRSPREQLLDYLRQKQMLLLLDNYEHLLPGTEIVAEIVQAAPGVHVVVTSRERLRLRGEQVLSLRGLAYEDGTGALHTGNGQSQAARLFLAVAGRIRADFSVRDNEEVQLRRICRLVEGLPLALELAATWADTLSLEAIADEIEQSLEFLETEVRDVPERHRSMRAVFDTSWGRLSPQEQGVFARLSVFRGGFTREAAEAVADATVQTLSRLVNRSLLRYEPEGDRYEIHELLRQYAATLLTPAETVHLRRRHLAYHADFVERLQPWGQNSEQRTVMDRLETEFGNMAAALDWSLQDRTCTVDGLRLASGLEDFWRARGHIDKGYEWLSRLLNMSDIASHSPRVRARALQVAGYLEILHTDDWIKATDFCKESLAIQEALGDDEGRVRTLLNLGRCARYANNFEEARVYIQDGLALAEEVNDRWSMCVALGLLGIMALMQHEIKAAHSFFERGLLLARQIGAPRRTARFLLGLGLVAAEENEWPEARSLVQEALTVFRENGDKNSVAKTLSWLGDLARCERQYEVAERYYNESMALWREVAGTSGFIANQLYKLGQTNLMMDRIEQAVGCFQESLPLIRSIDSPEQVAHALEFAANLANARHEPERAARLWGAAEMSRESVGYSFPPAHRLTRRHFVELARKQMDESAFEAAWAEGREMAVEEAVAYALDFVADNVESGALRSTERRWEEA